MVNAGGKIGLGVSAGAGGSAQVTILGNAGETVKFDVSEQTAQAFARDQARVRAEAIQDTFTNAQGLDYLTNTSKQMGASEAYSFLNDARKVEAATESFGANMQTAFVKDFTMNHYGDESPDNIRKSINSLAYTAQQDPARLNKMVEGFVSGYGYGWGETTNTVDSTINATKNRIHEDAILKGAVDYTANTANQKSSGITPNNLTPPGQKGLGEPDQTSTQDKADSLRSRNRYEESPSNGRIRTSATGMATEGVGKIFKGVVDSQGDRPTDEGAFNYVRTTRQVENTPPAGPIPKDAPSTLEGGRNERKK
jgi:conjugal transfer mating pair stabilization protein TraG